MHPSQTLVDFLHCSRHCIAPLLKGRRKCGHFLVYIALPPLDVLTVTWRLGYKISMIGMSMAGRTISQEPVSCVPIIARSGWRPIWLLFWSRLQGTRQRYHGADLTARSNKG